MSPQWLRIDSVAALLAGFLTAVLSSLLARWYGLPLAVLLALALANLAYGAYSGWLLSRPRPRPLRLIVVLVLANTAWSVICIALAVRFFNSASWLGLSHLLLEAGFVGMLASMEWRHRQRLRTQP